MNRTLKDLVRPNIWQLHDSPSDQIPEREGMGVLLDANESPYFDPLNRYPDASQRALKAAVSKVKHVAESCIFLGNGTDEVVDTIYRVFCRPGKDNVVAIAPTREQYRRYALINDVDYRPVALDEGFRLNATRLLAACNGLTKVVWLCSPNDPTGNNLSEEEIATILSRFDGIVVVDESYSDFSTRPTFLKRLAEFPRLVVISSLSHAWGCASLGVGMALAGEDITGLMNRVRAPFNLSTPVQQQAAKALQNQTEVGRWATVVLRERGWLIDAFLQLPFCEKVYPTDANFILVKFRNARAVCQYLLGQGIRVKDCTMIKGCADCLRITVGARGENSALLSALRQYEG